MNVRELLADATERLAAAGVENARTDAELLLAAVLGTRRSTLLTRDVVADAALAPFEDAVARRVTREPLQYITGRAPFRYLELEVGPGVFVPRPETELLVDAVLPHLRALERPAVVDLCSGSGALALAVLDEVPTASVVAVERSASALRWLTRNVSETNVQVVAVDVRDPEALSTLHGRADVVVSNPPYVPIATDVTPEVLADPREAVFGGEDGLELVPYVIACAALLLRRGGVFAMEHDDTQGESAPALLATDGGWDTVVDHRDLTGRPRYVTARRVAASVGAG